VLGPLTRLIHTSDGVASGAARFLRGQAGSNEARSAAPTSPPRGYGAASRSGERPSGGGFSVSFFLALLLAVGVPATQLSHRVWLAAAASPPAPFAPVLERPG
jgi:hypothetical protein